MTKDEFEERYASNSGMAVKELHNLGLYAKLCNCEYEGCEGWCIVHEGTTGVIEDGQQIFIHTKGNVGISNGYMPDHMLFLDEDIGNVGMGGSPAEKLDIYQGESKHGME